MLSGMFTLGGKLSGNAVRISRANNLSIERKDLSFGLNLNESTKKYLLIEVLFFCLFDLVKI